MGAALPKLTVVADEGDEDASGEAMTPDDIIADYLDHLCAPLVGVVPYIERSRLREETGYHLERLAGTYILEGESPIEATRRAVAKYGESNEVSQLFLETWFVHQPQGRLARRFGLANIRALTFFGAATLLTTTLVQMRVYWPNPQPLTFGLSVAQMRHLIPEPLPLPDGNPVSVGLAIIAIIAPVVAGWLTGASVPVRPARTVYNVQTLLTLYTFVLGAQMLPMREGVLLGVFQLFFWLPVGCLTAHIAAALTWRRRCRYAPRRAAEGAAR
jgi:hypothetical protein